MMTRAPASAKRQVARGAATACSILTTKMPVSGKLAETGVLEECVVDMDLSSQELKISTSVHFQAKLSAMTKPWKPGRYDLIDLRVFAAVAQNGTVLAAASQCHLAPSSVSQRITQLESSLGVKLFDRHARGLRLSSAGQVMLAHVNRLTATLEQMHADLAPYATGIHGHVTLLANSNAIASFLPGDMKSFLLAHEAAHA